MPKQFTLGKNERLRSRKQIELLFSKGRKFDVASFRIFFVFTGNKTQATNSNLLFGIGVSAKNFKKAADRNKIKRLAREAWRLQKNELKDKLAKADQQIKVFFIYTSKEMPEFNLVFEKIGIVIKKLIKEVEQ